MVGMRLHTVLAICSLMIAVRWPEVTGSATLELRMKIYDNSPEKDIDGNCCDLMCLSRCDHIFRFSLDKADGSQTNSQSGSIFSKDTSVFQDVDVNYFQDDMGGVANPIVSKYIEWPGRILFKLHVVDDDSPWSGNDEVDNIISALDLVPQPKATAKPITKILRGTRRIDPTSLNLDILLYCDANWYGPRCIVDCIAQDSDVSGHYTCNATTGDIVCLPGWKDTTNKCLTSINECTNHKCLHGATCVNGVGSYTCKCADGFFGTYCEGASNSQCPAGMIGRSCDVRVCDYVRCQNGGTCASGICNCPSGFIGPNCEESLVCNKRPCSNDGTCVEVHYRCECLPGYEGDHCDVPYNTTYAERQDGVMSSTTNFFTSEQGGPLLIALIVLVAVMLIILIILVIFLCIFRRRARNAEKDCVLLSRGTSSTITESEKSVINENFYNGGRFLSVSSVSSAGDTDDTVSTCERSNSMLSAKEADYAAINPVYTRKEAEYQECRGKKNQGPKPPARPQKEKSKVCDDIGDTLRGDKRLRC
jgi:hypothetical protein